MSLFDTEAFLGQETTEQTSTHRVPIPAGEVPGRIKELALNSGTSKTGNDWVILKVIFIIDSEEARKVTGMDEPTCKFDTFLDMTEDGALDFGEGKNTRLGKLREALGQNNAGESWSPNQMLGQPALLDITHRPDEDDPETVYAEVNSVTSLG